MTTFFEHGLPKATEEHALERESINTLESYLPKELFEFRPEPITDVGVDGSIEIKQNGQHLNARLPIQLKATALYKPNQDGSISISDVKTSNLRYLVNGGGLYILWVKERDELRYAWAIDELDRITAENATWENQATITISFKYVLSPSALNEIHGSTLQRARMASAVIGSVRTATSAYVLLAIDRDSLAVTDCSTAYELMKENGVSLIFDGKVDEVDRLHALLNPAQKQEPIMQFLSGFARYTRGDFLGARSELGLAAMGFDELPKIAQDLLPSLKNTSDFQIGKLKPQEYIERLRTASENDPTVLGLYLKQGYLRYSYILAETDSDRETYLAQLRVVVSQIYQIAELPQTVKLEANLSLLLAEAAEASYMVVEVFATSSFTPQRASQFLPRMRAVTKEYLRRVEEETLQALAQAVKLGEARLTAEFQTLSVMIRYLIMANATLLYALAGMPAPDLPLLPKAMQDIDIAQQIFSAENDTAGWIKAKLLQSKLLELAGKNEEARAVASEVQPIVDGRGLSVYEPTLNSFLNDQTSYSKAMAEIKEKAKLSGDEALALYKDDDVTYMAEIELKANNLSEDKLPALVSKWQKMVDEARVRIQNKPQSA